MLTSVISSSTVTSPLPLQSPTQRPLVGVGVAAMCHLTATPDCGEGGHREETAVPKFPAEAERSVTAQVAPARAYAFLWNVVNSALCIPGIDTCTAVDDDTYHFVFEEQSRGPISMTIQYTARYAGNGVDKITYASLDTKGGNTDVKGVIRLKASGNDATTISLRQKLAPDTPVPRMLQPLVQPHLEKEAAAVLEQFLANVKRKLEAGA